MSTSWLLWIILSSLTGRPILSAVVLLYVAVRMRPRGGIGAPPDPDLRRRLLVVVGRAVEDPRTTSAIAAEAREIDTRERVLNDQVTAQRTAGFPGKPRR